MLDGKELVDVQALVPEPSVERLAQAVIRGLSRSGEVEGHAVLPGPLIKGPRSELSAVIDGDHLIVKAGKNIENRDWPTRHRCRILIHAAKGMTRAEHEDAIAFAVRAIRADPRNADRTITKKVTLRDLGFAFEDLPRGGIIGSVEIVACATDSTSPWFVGKYGFMLRDPRPLPFTPWKGKLGLLEVPLSIDELLAGSNYQRTAASCPQSSLLPP